MVISAPLGERIRNIILLFGSTLTVMGGLTIAPSVAGMSAYFSSQDHAAFLSKLAVTLPSLVVAVSAFSMGRLVDRYGRRRILLICTLICGFSGSAGYFLDSLTVILLTRLCLGLGIAGLMISITTIAGDLFIGRERQRFLGLQSMSMNLGGVLFVGLGGMLADISWRLPFGLYSLSFVIFIGALLFVPETKVTNVPDDGRQARSNADKAPLAQLFSEIAPLYIVFTIISSFFYMAPILMALVFESLQLSSTQVGIALAFQSASSALIGLQFRLIVDKLGVTLVFAWVFLCMAVGYGLIGYSSGFSLIVVGLVITGFGLGTFIPLSYSCAMSVVQERNLGVAIGSITSAMFFGQFFSPIVSTPLQSVSLQGAFVSVSQGALVLASVLVVYKAYRAFIK